MKEYASDFATEAEYVAYVKKIVEGTMRSIEVDVDGVKYVVPYMSQNKRIRILLDANDCVAVIAQGGVYVEAKIPRDYFDKIRRIEFLANIALHAATYAGDVVTVEDFRDVLSTSKNDLRYVIASLQNEGTPLEVPNEAKRKFLKLPVGSFEDEPYCLNIIANFISSDIAQMERILSNRREAEINKSKYE